MKATNKILAVTGTVLALAGNGAAWADAPDHVKIRSISYAGTGCPAGSVAENMAPDFKAFTLLFDSYVAEVGPGVPFSAKRKNCAINVSLEFPQGWSFTIADIDYRGYAALERGVTGEQVASYYFQGDRATASLKSKLTGPVDKDYHIRDTLALSALVWSPCGANRSLTINTQVRLDNSRNSRANGVLTVDSIDGQLTHIYGLQWRRCR